MCGVDVPEQYNADKCKPIEGFDGLYQIAPNGTVWSLHSGVPRRKHTFPGELGPRVALYRFGERSYQPYVHTLVEKAFGKDTHLPPSVIAQIFEDYRDQPEARIWLEENLIDVQRPCHT